MFQRLLHRVTTATLALIALSSAAVAAPKGYPYQITATVGMVGDIARQVAGEKATVSVLLGAGVDPHLYKPTRDDVLSLMRADVVLYSGLMLEGKMADSLEKMGRSKPVHAVTELIEPSYLLKEDGDHSDPHVWMDPLAWGKCAHAAAKALAKYDPANAAFYEKNAETYAASCAALHAYGQKVLGSIPEKSRVLISSHDAFNYFGRAFGLKVMGVQGISTESETGLKGINELVDYIVANDVKAVFIESSVSPKNIEALVAGAKSRGKPLKIGGELFSDAMGAEGSYEGSYFGMLDHNITLVARALGGEAPAKGHGGKLSHAE